MSSGLASHLNFTAMDTLEARFFKRHVSMCYGGFYAL